MQAAQVEERTFILPSKGEAEKDREPHQEQGAGYEPLPEAYRSYLHQFQPRHHQEEDDEDGSHTKAIVDKELGHLCPAAAGIVTHTVVNGGQLFGRSILQHTLVSRPRQEEGGESQYQVESEEHQQQARDKMKGLITHRHAAFCEESRSLRLVAHFRVCIFYTIFLSHD